MVAVEGREVVEEKVEEEAEVARRWEGEVDKEGDERLGLDTGLANGIGRPSPRRMVTLTVPRRCWGSGGASDRAGDADREGTVGGSASERREEV